MAAEVVVVVVVWGYGEERGGVGPLKALLIKKQKKNDVLLSLFYFNIYINRSFFFIRDIS